MNWMLIPFVLAIDTGYQPLPINETPTEEKQERSKNDVEECEKGVKDLKNSVLGLEFFLKDKKEHKMFCPYIKWRQPSLEEYKNKPKSYLPKECKAEKL